jgi:hypothetical protein
MTDSCTSNAVLLCAMRERLSWPVGASVDTRALPRPTNPPTHSHACDEFSLYGAMAATDDRFTIFSSSKFIRIDAVCGGRRANSARVHRIPHADT